MELIAEVAAKEVARQRAVRNWQAALARVKALPPGAADAWGPLEQPNAPPAGPEEGLPQAAGTGQAEESAQGSSSPAPADGPQLPQAQRRTTAQQAAEGAQRGSAVGQVARPSERGTFSRSPSQLGRRTGLGSKASSFKRGTRAGEASTAAEGPSPCSPTGSSGSTAPGGRREGEAPPRGSGAGGRPPASLLGERASAAGGGRLSHMQGPAVPNGGGDTRGSAVGEPLVGRRATQQQQQPLGDVASVAVAMMAQHKQREGRGRLSKLPPLHLERLEKGWLRVVSGGRGGGWANLHVEGPGE